MPAFLAQDAVSMGQDRGMSTSYDEVVADLRDFAKQRDWGQFHTPRNLVLALVAEAGELAAEFQWLPESAGVKTPLTNEAEDRISGELADVASYLLLLADTLGVDLVDCVQKKIALNEHRYPVERVRGKAGRETRVDYKA
jgi:NTP pyrophosphatase (non-canonical NTP hydrolase)